MDADEGGNFEQPSAAMRSVQQRQTMFADSLDPRPAAAAQAQGAGALNDDLGNVYASPKDAIVVDFARGQEVFAGGQEEAKQSALPPGAFPPQTFDVIPPQPLAQQPTAPRGQRQALMDTQFMTNMMKTHVKLMQKQLEDGFGLIANKMNTLESRMNENDKHIKKVETGIVKDAKTKDEKEQENKQLFSNLQESIALQQQSMLQFI